MPATAKDIEHDHQRSARSYTTVLYIDGHDPDEEIKALLGVSRHGVYLSQSARDTVNLLYHCRSLHCESSQTNWVPFQLMQKDKQRVNGVGGLCSQCMSKVGFEARRARRQVVCLKTCDQPAPLVSFAGDAMKRQPVKILYDTWSSPKVDPNEALANNLSVLPLPPGLWRVTKGTRRLSTVEEIEHDHAHSARRRETIIYVDAQDTDESLEKVLTRTSFGVHLSDRARAGTNLLYRCRGETCPSTWTTFENMCPSVQKVNGVDTICLSCRRAYLRTEPGFLSSLKQSCKQADKKLQQKMGKAEFERKFGKVHSEWFADFITSARPNLFAEFGPYQLELTLARGYGNTITANRINNDQPHCAPNNILLDASCLNAPFAFTIDDRFRVIAERYVVWDRNSDFDDQLRRSRGCNGKLYQLILAAKSNLRRKKQSRNLMEGNEVGNLQWATTVLFALFVIMGGRCHYSCARMEFCQKSPFMCSLERMDPTVTYCFTNMTLIMYGFNAASYGEHNRDQSEEELKEAAIRASWNQKWFDAGTEADPDERRDVIDESALGIWDVLSAGDQELVRSVLTNEANAHFVSDWIKRDSVSQKLLSQILSQ